MVRCVSIEKFVFIVNTQVFGALWFSVLLARLL